MILSSKDNVSLCFCSHRTNRMCGTGRAFHNKYSLILCIMCNILCIKCKCVRTNRLGIFISQIIKATCYKYFRKSRMYPKYLYNRGILKHVCIKILKIYLFFNRKSIYSINSVPFLKDIKQGFCRKIDMCEYENLTFLFFAV